MSASPAPAEGTPTLAIDGDVATITLRRPSRRNSLGDDDLHTLLEHLARIEHDQSIHIVVLDADVGGLAKPVFSSGYFIGGFASGKHDPLLFERVPDTLEKLRPITICSLRGSVYGGSTDIMLACDLRVAMQGTEFRMPAAALGLHYYPHGLRRYVSRLGVNFAKKAFLTARSIPIETLAERGLFEHVAAPEAFDAALADTLGAVKALGPLAARMLKASINDIAAGHFDERLLRERETISMASADFAEGRAAFAERRAPRFTGR